MNRSQFIVLVASFLLLAVIFLLPMNTPHYFPEFSSSGVVIWERMHISDHPLGRILAIGVVAITLLLLVIFRKRK